MDIRKLFEQGQAAMNATRAESELDKAGSFRIGTSGVVGADGEIYGTCHRIGMARLQGNEKPIADSQQIMFRAGEKNEETWTDWLTAAGINFKTHDEVAVSVDIPGTGRKVIGHPDIVICDAAGNPVLGMELKGIYGFSTMNLVYMNAIPKNENLIQMAAYSHYSGIPYCLVYTQATWGRVGATQIKPFIRVFYTEWRDGVLWYRSELEQSWTRTLVTTKGIEEYYQLIHEMGETKQLGPRLNANYVGGAKNKQGVLAGCKYCDFKTACDKYDGDNNYDNWIEAIKAPTEGGEE